MGTLVSCLCVTRGDDCILTAIQCFLRQTHEDKELVIVHQGLSDRIVRRIEESQTLGTIRMVQGMQDVSLGFLRNLSLANAKGDYVCQWDDDDWYHPTRIRTQLDWVQRHGAKGCVLSQWFMRDLTTGKMYLSYRRRTGWEGSILVEHEAACRAAYPNLICGEDGIFLSVLRRHKHRIDVLDNYPSLYVYTYHGGNTWGREHFERLFQSSSELPAHARDEILAGMAR